MNPNDLVGVESTRSNGGSRPHGSSSLIVAPRRRTAERRSIRTVRGQSGKVSECIRHTAWPGRLGDGRPREVPRAQPELLCTMLHDLEATAPLPNPAMTKPLHKASTDVDDQSPPQHHLLRNGYEPAGRRMHNQANRRVRKPLLYPLSYEGVPAQATCLRCLNDDQVGAGGRAGVRSGVQAGHAANVHTLATRGTAVSRSARSLVR